MAEITGKCVDIMHVMVEISMKNW